MEVSVYCLSTGDRQEDISGSGIAGVYVLSTTAVSKLFGTECPAVILMGLVQVLVVNSSCNRILPKW